jgi:hypothetical protein
MDFDLTISDRIIKLKEKREWYNKGHLRLNTERTRLITKYYKEHGVPVPDFKAVRAFCMSGALSARLTLSIRIYL